MTSCHLPGTRISPILITWGILGARLALATTTVFSSCSSECECPDGGPCEFQGNTSSAMKDSVLRCPRTAEDCTIVCSNFQACRGTEVYIYGGGVSIFCSAHIDSCKYLKIVADDSANPTVHLDCDSFPFVYNCLNVNITQIHSGGSLLVDVNCQGSTSCSGFTLPNNTVSSTYVRNTGHAMQLGDSTGCSIGEWACGNTSNCDSGCTEVDSIFAYENSFSPTTQITYAPSSSHPLTTHPLTPAPLTLAPSSSHPLTTQPLTLAPSSSHPLTTQPFTLVPLTLAPLSSHPLTTQPLTLAPSSSHPLTTQPFTLVPLTFAPSSSHPLTTQPLTLAPSSSHPLTTHPFTLTPLTLVPLTLAPSSSHPLTTHPLTTHPLTTHPLTNHPLTNHPGTLGPLTLAPSSSHPLTTHPLTTTPTSFQPVTIHPNSFHPLTNNPVTSSPGTGSPATCEPSSLFPVTRGPVTREPSSGVPVTLGPVTCGPSTCVPVTSCPASIHPGTSVPVTLRPSTLEPISQGPSTLSPVSNHPSASTRNPTPLPTARPTVNPISPTTQTPLTLNPSTTIPSTKNPLTGSPVSLSPSTVGPSVAPITAGPATRSPSLSIMSVSVEHKHLRVKEDFPPWDSASSYVVDSTDRFSVYNSVSGQFIRVTCRVDIDEVDLYHERFQEDGSSEYHLSSTIVLGGDDPTHWECIPNGKMGRVSIRCNDGDIDYSDVPEPTRCGVPELWEQSGIPRGFSCPTPCYKDTTANGGCYGLGGLSSVGVFSVRGKYNGNATTSTSFAVTCSVNNMGSDQSSGFQLGGTLENVNWPEFTDLLVGYPGGFLSSTSQDQMSLTVATATPIVALGRNGFHDPFDESACPEVYVGNQLALNITCNSNNVSFTTPYYRDICGDSDNCGYFPIQIRNPDIDGKAAGGVVMCPPGCPKPGLGIFYTPECIGYSSPSICSASALLGNSDGLKCAWGAKDDCKICDVNGLCPGGYRLWSQPGYFAQNERVTSLVQCPRPSKERCIGWDIEKSSTKCGEAYTGTRCTTCMSGYYERLGECQKCPNGGMEKRAEKLIILIMILFAVFILIALSTLIAYRRASKEMKAIGLYQAKDFVLWSFLVLQVHGLVISSASGLTSEVKTLFSWIRIVNFEFEAVGPECFSNKDPFRLETIIMSIALSAFVLNATFLDRKELKVYLSHAKISTIRSLLFRLSTTMYTPATFISLSMIHCQLIPGEDGESYLVSSHNNNYKCFGDVHVRPAVLAILTILTCSLGYPVWTFCILKKTKEDFESLPEEDDGDFEKVIERHQATKRWKVFRHFFGDDYFPRYYWALHVHFFVVWTLCCTLVFANTQTDSSQGIKLAINVTVVLGETVFLCVCSPYLPHVSWKATTKISVLIVVCLNNVLDMVNYLHSSGRRANHSSVVVLSNIVFAGAMINFIVLFAAFCLIVLKTSSWRKRMRTHFLIRMATTHELIRMNFSLNTKSFARRREESSKTGSRFPKPKSLLQENGTLSRRPSLSASSGLHKSRVSNQLDQYALRSRSATSKSATLDQVSMTQPATRSRTNIHPSPTGSMIKKLLATSRHTSETTSPVGRSTKKVFIRSDPQHDSRTGTRDSKDRGSRESKDRFRLERASQDSRDLLSSPRAFFQRKLPRKSDGQSCIVTPGSPQSCRSSTKSKESFNSNSILDGARQARSPRSRNLSPRRRANLKLSITSNREEKSSTSSCGPISPVSKVLTRLSQSLVSSGPEQASDNATKHVNDGNSSRETSPMINDHKSPKKKNLENSSKESSPMVNAQVQKTL
ncbi:hypothetical protein AAMO2058_001047200 [Amorphochlora amoebiformis]